MTGCSVLLLRASTVSFTTTHMRDGTPSVSQWIFLMSKASCCAFSENPFCGTSVSWGPESSCITTQYSSQLKRSLPWTSLTLLKSLESIAHAETLLGMSHRLPADHARDMSQPVARACACMHKSGDPKGTSTWFSSCSCKASVVSERALLTPLTCRPRRSSAISVDIPGGMTPLRGKLAQ